MKDSTGYTIPQSTSYPYYIDVKSIDPDTKNACYL